MVLLLLGMQFLDLSILTAAHFSLKKSLALCYSTLKFWWLSLVPCWISFPTPIHMLHSDLGCENHTTSKIMIFTNFRQDTHCILVWNANFSHLGFFFLFSPEAAERLLRISLKNRWNLWKIPLKNPQNSFAKLGLIPSKILMFRQSEQLVFSAAHRRSVRLFFFDVLDP